MMVWMRSGWAFSLLNRLLARVAKMARGALGGGCWLIDFLGYVSCSKNKRNKMSMQSKLKHPTPNTSSRLTMSQCSPSFFSSLFSTLCAHRASQSRKRWTSSASKKWGRTKTSPREKPSAFLRTRRVLKKGLKGLWLKSPQFRESSGWSLVFVANCIIYYYMSLGATQISGSLNWTAPRCGWFELQSRPKAGRNMQRLPGSRCHLLAERVAQRDHCGCPTPPSSRELRSVGDWMKCQSPENRRDGKGLDFTNRR